VGGAGGTSAACTASGGTWEARGEEGVTIAMKKVLASAEGPDKRNSILWETNRSVDGQGRAVNGTGTQLLIDNISTSDGGDFNGDGVDDNTYGIRTDLTVDIYQTRVTKKEDGPDSRGVIGSRGGATLRDPTASQGYPYVAARGQAAGANRPLGFAVQADTRFKGSSIDYIDLIHPNGGAQTAGFGAKMQDFDI